MLPFAMEAPALLQQEMGESIPRILLLGADLHQDKMPVSSPVPGFTLGAML